MLLKVKITNLRQLKQHRGSILSKYSLVSKDPITTPTSKSATVRFIIRYIVRLRKWRFLAKAKIVKALMINITIHSGISAPNRLFFSCRKNSISVSLIILKKLGRILFFFSSKAINRVNGVLLSQPYVWYVSSKIRCSNFIYISPRTTFLGWYLLCTSNFFREPITRLSLRRTLLFK